MRNPTTYRKEHIEKYFTNISLNRTYVDIYYVRKSILNFIHESLGKFHGVLLDVGCGIMPYRELILSQNKNVSAYIGLDFENSLDAEYALGKPDLFWDGNIIPLENDSADNILATELLEHCPEPEKVLKDMLRVLKPGGKLFLTVPFIWNLHLIPHDEYRYTPFSLSRHLSNAGFINIKLNALGGLDASLSQMISIWLKNKKMNRYKKRILSFFLLPAINELIKMDKKSAKNQMFHEGSMITGLSGIAEKAL